MKYLNTKNNEFRKELISALLPKNNTYKKYISSIASTIRNYALYNYRVRMRKGGIHRRVVAIGAQRQMRPTIVVKV